MPRLARVRRAFQEESEIQAFTAIREMLFTPNVVVAACAESETNLY